MSELAGPQPSGTDPEGPQVPSPAGTRSTPWYFQWWFIIVALVFASWLGFIPLWLSPMPTKRMKITLTVSVVVLQGLLFCAFFSLSGGLSLFGITGSGPVIPSTPADMSFAAVQRATPEGQTVILSLKADSEGAREIGRPVEDSKYLTARVRVDKNTKIIDQRGIGGSKTGQIDDVLAAKHVDVWFSGPAAESNPVQATAATIVVGWD